MSENMHDLPLIVPAEYLGTPEDLQTKRLQRAPAQVVAALSADPLVLRAHHLVSFAGETYAHPDLTAEAHIQAFKVDAFADPDAAKSPLPGEGLLSRQQYARDVVGNSPEDAYRTQSGVAALLGHIGLMEDGAAVTVAIRERDAVCHSCVIGNHCTDPLTNDESDISALHVAEDIVTFIETDEMPANKNPWGRDPLTFNARQLRGTLFFLGRLSQETAYNPKSLVSFLHGCQTAGFHALASFKSDAKAIRQEIIRGVPGITKPL